MNGITQDGYRIKFYDCDSYGKVKLSALLKIFSEIAGYDYNLKGFSHEYLWEREMVFLISKVTIHISRQPRDQEELTIKTWERGKKGAMYLRGCSIESADGETITDSVSGWVLVNPITRRIYKPSHFDGGFPQLTEIPMTAPVPSKILYGDLAEAGTHEVRFSELDSNGHLYNAGYADIAMDVLTEEERRRSYTDFAVSFVGEAKLGDRITLFKQSKADSVVIVGRIDGRECFELSMAE